MSFSSRPCLKSKGTVANVLSYVLQESASYSLVCDYGSQVVRSFPKEKENADGADCKQEDE